MVCGLIQDGRIDFVDENYEPGRTIKWVTIEYYGPLRTSGG